MTTVQFILLVAVFLLILFMLGHLSKELDQTRKQLESVAKSAALNREILSTLIDVVIEYYKKELYFDLNKRKGEGGAL